MKLDEMRLEDYEMGDRIVVSLNYGMGPEVIGTIIEKHEDIRDDGSNRPGVVYRQDGKKTNNWAYLDQIHLTSIED
jgi:hypothetical protein